MTQQQGGAGCVLLPIAMVFCGALAVALGVSIAWGIVIGIGAPIALLATVTAGAYLWDTMELRRRRKRNEQKRRGVTR